MTQVIIICRFREIRGLYVWLSQNYHALSRNIIMNNASSRGETYKSAEPALEYKVSLPVIIKEKITA
jgi:hypothetical protein